MLLDDHLEKGLHRFLGVHALAGVQGPNKMQEHVRVNQPVQFLSCAVAIRQQLQLQERYDD